MDLTLINLGCVTSTYECFEFLYNMFNDKYVSFRNPFLRKTFAIAMLSRSPSTCKILKVAPSPLKTITHSQAEKLKNILNTQVDYCFSYTKPYCKPTDACVLPLYPIYSKTLYGKIFEIYHQNKIIPPLCTFKEFNDFFVERLKEALNNNKIDSVIFSNHSLPLYLAKNDPYEKDTYNFCSTIAKTLNLKEYYVTFQSKLGPIKWLEPSTSSCLKKLANKRVLIVPVSFISDNTETVYEIGYTYKNFADKLNIQLHQFKCFNDDDAFLTTLAKIVKRYL